MSQRIERIYHTWDKWECYPAGFYETKDKRRTKEECENEYKNFLSDLSRFGKGMRRVLDEWTNSCEHYLTNEKMNRLAWLGQSALCIETGIPSCYRSGYFLLSKEERAAADNLALIYLNAWLLENGYSEVDLQRAGVKAHANIY